MAMANFTLRDVAEAHRAGLDRNEPRLRTLYTLGPQDAAGGRYCAEHAALYIQRLRIEHYPPESAGRDYCDRWRTGRCGSDPTCIPPALEAVREQRRSRSR
jgi:hypothetical protein